MASAIRGGAGVGIEDGDAGLEDISSKMKASAQRAATAMKATGKDFMGCVGVSGQGVVRRVAGVRRL